VIRLLATEASADQMLAADAGFAAAFDEYQQAYGQRVTGYDVAQPTLAEQPEIVLAMVRDGLAADTATPDMTIKRARQALAEAHRTLAVRAPGERDRFDRELAAARRAYPVREDNTALTMTSPYALVRRAALEVGRRLADRNQIPTPDDVFWLTSDQALTALIDGTDSHDLVERRRAERAWVLAHPGPSSYGQQPPPPSLDGVPDEARRVTESIMWVAEHILAPAESQSVQPAGRELTGIGAAPGRYTGVARVINGRQGFDRLQPGDVLICPITSPAWSVVYGQIGALVTDTGGPLSHPAIIAREFGIPTVVATGNATALIRDGQTVTVNGTTGTVRIKS
jgi:pyruvate,water dikinase